MHQSIPVINIPAPGRFWEKPGDWAERMCESPGVARGCKQPELTVYSNTIYVLVSLQAYQEIPGDIPGDNLSSVEVKNLLSLIQIMRKKINPPDLCQFSIMKIRKILQAFCFLEACPFWSTKQTQPWSRWPQPTTFVLIFDLNECQLQQADQQNKIKPHVKVLFSNLQLWSHITNKVVPYQ